MSRQIINDSSPSETSGQVGTSTINQIENEQTLQEVNTETLTSGQVGTSTISQVEEEKDFFNDSDTYEKELVINGRFDTNSDWILGSATISGGLCTMTSSGGAMTYFYQSGFDLTAGTSYKISFTANRLSGDTNLTFVSSNGNNVAGAPTISSSGAKTIYFTPSTNVINFGLKRSAGATGAVWEVDNFSVKEVVPFDGTSGQVGASTINQVEDERDFFNSSDTYEKEFVTNGDFSNGSEGWTLNDSATVQNEKLVINTDNGEQNFLQSNVLQIGKEYRLTLDADLDVGVIRFESGEGANYLIDTSSQYVEHYFIADFQNLIFRRNVAPTRGTLDNISIKEVVPFNDTSGQTVPSTINQIENERVVTS